MQKLRANVIKQARSYLGVPWRHQGRSRTLGMDCAGLVILVAHDLGLSAYDTIDYQRRTQGQSFLRHFKTNLIGKPISEALPGDIMLFRDSQYPCHSTLLGERNGKMTIIHAHALRRKVVEETMEQGDWMNKRVACFSYPDLEDL